MVLGLGNSERSRHRQTAEFYRQGADAIASAINQLQRRAMTVVCEGCRTSYTNRLDMVYCTNCGHLLGLPQNVQGAEDLIKTFTTQYYQTLGRQRSEEVLARP